jgi:hypothetical protein
VDGSRVDAAPYFPPKAPAPALQQIGSERALLVEGRLPPAVIRLTPSWHDRELGRRAGLGGRPQGVGILHPDRRRSKRT